MQLKVHGMMLSPWVRRLVATIKEKGLDYEMVNVVPMGEPDPEFLRISPLGKVPVLEIDGRHMPDSLAACVLLEAEYPSTPLFPTKSWERAWMFWQCDFMATALFTKVEMPLFIERFVKPNFQQTDPDQGVIDKALAEVARVFGYLEAQLSHGQAFFGGGSVSLADLTAASIFINFGHAGEKVDAEKWPRLAEYLDRMYARPSFKHILEIERNLFGEISPFFVSK